MTRFSPKIIKASIMPGSVYYFREEQISSNEPHYFIVVNLNPQTDEIIVLACASHQIEKTRNRRNGCPEETLIIITPKQYCDFTKLTIIDCNRIIPLSITQIMSKYENNALDVKTEMDIKLVETIRRGILASRQIQPRIKHMLRTSEA
jgi:hypothetical protein